MSKVPLRWREFLNDDPEYLAPRLREADRVECLNLRVEPLYALRYPVENELHEFTRTILDPDGNPIAIVGCVPQQTSGNKAVIWMLMADLPRGAKPGFIRAVKVLLKLAKMRFDELENIVSCENHDAIYFIKKMGFDINPRVMHFYNAPFYHFGWKRAAPKD